MGRWLTPVCFISYKFRHDCRLSSSPSLLDSISIFSHVEDQHEFMRVVVGHELVSSGLNVRKRIYDYVFYVGLNPLMFIKAGLRLYKALTYKSLFLSQLSYAPPPGSDQMPHSGDQQPVKCRKMRRGVGQEGMGVLGIDS